MIKQNLKELYFSINRIINYPYAKFSKLKNDIFNTERNIYLHLGCGHEYIKGFINIDGNIFQKKDMWLDLNNGLPFRTNSIELIYCSHTLEHFYPHDAIRLLKEMNRVLSISGIIRLAVPSFEYALQIMNGNASSTWPRKFDDLTGQAINYIFCEGQHKYAYNHYILTEFSKLAGFTNIYNYSENQGCKIKDYFGRSIGNEPAGSLILELRK